MKLGRLECCLDFLVLVLPTPAKGGFGSDADFCVGN